MCALQLYSYCLNAPLAANMSSLSAGPETIIVLLIDRELERGNIDIVFLHVMLDQQQIHNLVRIILSEIF